jgi:hypothetical protein
MPYESHRAPFLRPEIIDRLRAGERLKDICADDHMPCTRVVAAWRKTVPGFAEELDAAKRHAHFCRHVRFDQAKADEYLARLAAGETTHDLRRDPRMPSRKTLRAWMGAGTGFGARYYALTQGHRAEHALRLRHRRKDFDRDLADRILGRLHKGQSLLAILRSDPALPCYQILRRWRREVPEFDRQVRFFVQVWSRRRAAPRQRARIAAVAAEIRLRMASQGLSLNQIGGQPDMPSPQTLYAWMDRHPDFAEAVWRGCLERDAWHLEKLVVLADSAVPGAVGALRRRMGPHQGALSRAARNRPGRRALAASDSPAARRLKACSD